MNSTTIYLDFTSSYTHTHTHFLVGCIVLWNFITCRDSCNSHHNQDTELFCHHKESVLCTALLSLTPGNNTYGLHQSNFVISKTLYSIYFSFSQIAKKYFATLRTMWFDRIHDKQVKRTVLHGILMISKACYTPLGPGENGAQVWFQSIQLQSVYTK